MNSLKGRTALVTGGARGIGRGLAEAALKAGARVMLADLSGVQDDWSYGLSDDSELAATRDALAAFGDVEAVPIDVTQAASCEQAVVKTIERFGSIDILANNAGVVGSGPIDTFEESQWDQIFAVNVKGIFLVTQAAISALRRAKDACIINTASIAGKTGFPNMSAYCGSKFAAIGITQSLAVELAKDGIRVNAICPGMVGTSMWLEHLLPTNATTTDQKGEEFETLMQNMIPMGRAQTVDDMGQAFVFLATAPNITGVALNVAGGFEMH